MPPAGEVPLTPEQEEKNILEKGSVTPEEMDLKISIEKKKNELVNMSR